MRSCGWWMRCATSPLASHHRDSRGFAWRWPWIRWSQWGHSRPCRTCQTPSWGRLWSWSIRPWSRRCPRTHWRSNFCSYPLRHRWSPRQSCFFCQLRVVRGHWWFQLDQWFHFRLNRRPRRLLSNRHNLLDWFYLSRQVVPVVWVLVRGVLLWLFCS